MWWIQYVNDENIANIGNSSSETAKIMMVDDFDTPLEISYI